MLKPFLLLLTLGFISCEQTIEEVTSELNDSDSQNSDSGPDDYKSELIKSMVAAGMDSDLANEIASNTSVNRLSTSSIRTSRISQLNDNFDFGSTYQAVMVDSLAAVIDLEENSHFSSSTEYQQALSQVVEANIDVSMSYYNYLQYKKFSSFTLSSNLIEYSLDAIEQANLDDASLNTTIEGLTSGIAEGLAETDLSESLQIESVKNINHKVKDKISSLCGSELEQAKLCTGSYIKGVAGSLKSVTSDSDNIGELVTNIVSNITDGLSNNFSSNDVDVIKNNFDSDLSTAFKNNNPTPCNVIGGKGIVAFNSSGLSHCVATSCDTGKTLHDNGSCYTKSIALRVYTAESGGFTLSGNCKRAGIHAWGAGGGATGTSGYGAGGGGAYVYTEIEITENTNLNYIIGGGGNGHQTNSQISLGATGGYNGGGNGGDGAIGWTGGASGGGRTEISFASNDEFIAIAGGGGGGGRSIKGGAGGLKGQSPFLSDSLPDHYEVAEGGFNGIGGAATGIRPYGGYENCNSPTGTDGGEHLGGNGGDCSNSASAGGGGGGAGYGGGAGGHVDSFGAGAGGGSFYLASDYATYSDGNYQTPGGSGLNIYGYDDPNLGLIEYGKGAYAYTETANDGAIIVECFE